MTLLAGIVAVAFGFCLIGFTGVVFARPAIAERFLMAFASSPQAHYAEQACRLLLGTSLIVLSPAVWQATAFRIIGWAIVMTSLVLLLLPWRWHNRFAKRVLPPLVRRMTLYAVGVFAFGCLLLYGGVSAIARGAP